MSTKWWLLKGRCDYKCRVLRTIQPKKESLLLWNVMVFWQIKIFSLSDFKELEIMY